MARDDIAPPVVTKITIPTIPTEVKQAALDALKQIPDEQKVASCKARWDDFEFDISQVPAAGGRKGYTRVDATWSPVPGKKRRMSIPPIEENATAEAIEAAKLRLVTSALYQDEVQKADKARRGVTPP